MITAMYVWFALAGLAVISFAVYVYRGKKVKVKHRIIRDLDMPITTHIAVENFKPYYFCSSCGCAVIPKNDGIYSFVHGCKTTDSED